MEAVHDRQGRNAKEITVQKGELLQVRTSQHKIKKKCKCTSVSYIHVKSPHLAGNLIKVKKVFKKIYFSIRAEFCWYFFIYNNITP